MSESLGPQPRELEPREPESREPESRPAGRVSLVEVSAEKLSVERHRLAVDRAASGACSIFAGVVRDHDDGRSVLELEYVAHPSADAVLREVAAEIEAFAGVRAVAVSHRVGRLRIGDLALVAAVSSPHRAEAFAAIEELVERVKARLPVWKLQIFADGSEEWVNCP
jgi:molybdopterin synthase catalytic subunit